MSGVRKASEVAAVLLSASGAVCVSRSKLAVLDWSATYSANTRLYDELV